MLFGSIVSVNQRNPLTHVAKRSLSKLWRVYDGTLQRHRGTMDFPRNLINVSDLISVKIGIDFGLMPVLVYTGS